MPESCRSRSARQCERLKEPVSAPGVILAKNVTGRYIPEPGADRNTRKPQVAMAKAANKERAYDED
jgi:hypothetical protein|uniref:Uncharacterized protein n=1 Tax=Myoviridae sp. ct5xZ3 TaxID=2827601 RepID=A0A8S5RRP9_9CAUD|nr:MAG TPA: hypothetical protein [Myoviridae sp. ct5xZ3]